jgi:hypothetical protein
MLPGPILQLRVVIKALRDVIAPAIDPDNRVAAEQLHLSIATLSLMEARLPLLHRGARQELANAITLGETLEMVAEAKGLLATPLAAACAALADATVDMSELENCKARLLTAVSNIVAHSPDAVADRRIAQAVISASKPQCDLARAWCLPAGFEPDPAELPVIESLLDGKTQQNPEDRT